MRAWWLLLALGCSKSDDDKAWEAYQAEVRKAVKEGMPPVDLSRPPAPSPPNWYSLPDSFYDAWFGSGMNVELHRPSWDAQRLLEKDMVQSGAITLGLGFGESRASDAAIDTLIAATSHADWNVRARALFILADVPGLGERPDARERLLPVAGAAFADPSGVVRSAAAHALGCLLEEVEADKTAAISELTRLAKDPEFFVRHNAAKALGKLGAAPSEAVDVLRGDLRHENWWVVSGATVALLKMGPRARAAVPDLLELLKHPTDTCRTNAYGALEKIDPPALKKSPDAEKVRKEVESRLRSPY